MNLLNEVSQYIPEMDQRWGDVWFRGGYYIQRNVKTDIYRLLDSEHTVIMEKDFESCLEYAMILSPEYYVSPHAVVLLHGIGRTKHCMYPVEMRLEEDFTVINVSYPSLFCGLNDHAAQVRKIVDSLVHIETVSFVGYSLGGLVVRQALSDNINFNLGRVVLIGTPNQGAMMADIVKDLKPYKYITGECGQVLRTDRATQVKSLEGDFGIIAGGTGFKIGNNPILSGDNDGLVKVSETRMEGAADFLMVKSDHHFLIQREETLEATYNFLKTGRFSDEKNICSD